MPIPPQDRPLETLREGTIDQLIMNYSHGRLSMEAFQRRLDEAFEARDHDALAALTADLDLRVDSGYQQHKEESLGARVDLTDADDVEHIVTILSGNERKGSWRVPRELRIVNIFGGTDLDFTDARFSSRTTRVKIFCLFGGVDIGVPPDANVTVNAVCILGGIDNKAPQEGGPDAPQLIVDGFVLLGGADIKVRKTVRERMVAFADGLRAMFNR